VTASLAGVGAITLFVEDPKRSKAFYENVFALSPVFEDDESAVFKLENTLVNVLKASAAHELIAPAAVADGSSGSRFQLTVWVDDADATCAELAKRGVELLNGPIDRPWGVRTAAFADPDGHVWEVAQQLAQD
jgi:catechol 2,3-dioxygenase-like lactoylglutathione lyase family enzyme